MKFLLLLVLLAFQAVASDIHICYVSDDNYALPTRVSLNSLLKHSDPSDHLNIHIVDFGITQENKFAIENLKSVRDFNLDFVNFDISKFDERGLAEYGCGKSIYCRFFFQEIFPDLDKLIFLDGDTIVENSFKNLWNTELGDNYWAGADHNGYYSFPHSLNHCAAVMLLNLKKFREDNLTEKLVENTLQGQKRRKYTEEDALNVVCRGKITTIPFRNNIHIWRIPKSPAKDSKILPSTLNLFKEMKNAVVWHYSGKMKPWNTSLEEFSKRYPDFLYHKWWEYK